MRRRDNSGFTLIELIVVISIIALMSGAGLATFLNLRDRRIVLADARLVEQNLREAQRRAFAGEKPSECGTNPLTGYQVRIEQGSIYQSAICPGSTIPEVQVDMSGSVLTATLGSFVFGSTKGGATAGSINICQSGGGKYEYQIVVNSTGSVDSPLELPGPC